MRTALLTIFAVLAASPMALQAQKESAATDRLAAAADVLTDMMRADDKGIPQDLMGRASCIVIVPNLKKAGFILGAKYGRGFAMCRRANGAGWTAPASIRVEGGSFGLQIGGTEQDIVLLVMGDSGMKHLLQDKFTLGGDASAAAGPIGRAASAETDAQLHAEMLSYSRSRGLFGGLTLEGATLRPDKDANKELYGRDVENRAILQGDVKTPPAAEKLEQLLDKNSLRRTG
jgi:lipid-binding SYLF domain-containing protein